MDTVKSDNPIFIFPTQPWKEKNTLKIDHILGSNPKHFDAFSYHFSWFLTEQTIVNVLSVVHILFQFLPKSQSSTRKSFKS